MRRTLKDFIDKLENNKELQDTKKFCKKSTLIQDYLKYKEQAISEFWKYTICLYQVGSFYECYFEDAFVLSHVLNITLTNRNKSQEYSPQMSGFQCEWIEEKSKILTNNWLVVYIISQEINEDTSSEIVNRSVEKILPPTKEWEANGSFIWSIEYLWDQWRLSFIEVNDLRYYVHYTKNINKEIIINLIYYYNIDELLVSDTDVVSISKLNELKNTIDYKKITLIEKNQSPIFSYIKKVYFDHDSVLLNSLEPVIIIEEYNNKMKLSDTTLQNLEVLKTKEWELWSLFDCVNNTSTKMGQRYLYNMLSNPYKTIDNIQTIQWEINSLIWMWVENIMKLKSYMYWIEDMDKIIAKIISWRILPKDILDLRISIENFLNIKEICNKYLTRNNIKSSLPIINNKDEKKIDKKIDQIVFLLNNIFLEDFTKNSIKNGNIFKRWHSNELDSCLDVIDNIDVTKQEYLEQINQKTWLMFEVYETINWWYLSINNKKLPKDKSFTSEWRETKSTSVYQRYETNELNKIFTDYVLAKRNRDVIEYNLFKQLRFLLVAYLTEFRLMNNYISYLDYLLSWSLLVVNNKWVFPEIHNWQEVRIINWRHPMLEMVIGHSEIVQNHVFFSDSTSFKCLTGINMGGKTIYMKMMGLLSLLTHCGLPIPADEWYIGLMDNIYVRAGASDNFLKEQSTFSLEMNELSYILNNYTEKSLILIDEIGRGTDVKDGYPIALASAEDIINKKARCIFATHFHDISKDIEIYDNAKNMKVVINIFNNWELDITHKIIDWKSDENSYGLHIAKISWLPIDVLNRAYEIKDKL